MRRTIIRTLAAALAFASLMSVPAWAETAVVTGSEVNVRSGPGTNYRVIDCLPYGTEVNVTDQSNATWYAVDFDGQSGFMSAQYLSIRDQQTPAPAAPIRQEPDEYEGSPAYVNAMYVRFRSGPGSDYSVLGEYNQGKAVTLVDYTGHWAYCVIDGRAGYVYEDYITLGQAATPTPAPTPEPTQEPVPAPSPSPTAAPLASPEAPVQSAPTVEARAAGSIRGSYVRFRTGPGTNYQIIDVLDPGTPLLIVGEAGDWTACVIDGVFGYVHSAYVEVDEEAPLPEQTTQPVPSGSAYAEAGAASTPEPTAEPEPTPTPTPVPALEGREGYIAGNNVRMRSAASMSAPILRELFYGNRVTITGVYEDWTGVWYDGQIGFVYSSFVKEGSLTVAGTTVTGSAYASGANTQGGESETPAVTQPETGTLSGSSYEKGQQIAQYALQFLGWNYCWGGKDPSTGFDCSGLVYYVYGQFGYTLNRVAQDQARNGVAVEPDELQPGDILCFYSGASYIGHVGIYIGDGMFVHAQNSATGVVITDLNGYYGTRGFVARRIV